MKNKICNLLGIYWIVSESDLSDPGDEGEMGLQIMGVQFWYYKYSEPMITFRKPAHKALKREFGEVVKSLYM